MLPPPGAPMAVARIFMDNYHAHECGPTLRHWRGAWWSWRNSHWVEVCDRGVRSALYGYTEKAIYKNDDGKFVPWGPTRRKIGDVFEALAAICFLDNDVDQPAWLDGRTTGVIVAVNNGLLDIKQQRLLPHTPQFFNQTAVPFDYDKRAPYCTRWLEFLKQLWPNEPAAVDILAEWFGYVISGRLDLHKILLMVGPTRGGKGVIARVLTSLLGKQNVCGPTLNSLGGDFGLAPLLGKPLAIISDARFVGKNGSIVVERLLSISGEDTLTVNRKYRDQWNGKLPCRLHVISNELPRLGDASTAIVGRIILLPLSNLWLGKEDHGLKSALQSELSGILKWGLVGLQRLTGKNGNRFTRLLSADEAITTMRDLASPVAAFVREQCDVGPDLSIAVDDIYAAYKKWAEDNGHPRTTKQNFGRDLSAAVPRISMKRLRDNEVRSRAYAGIDMRASGPQDELI